MTKAKIDSDALELARILSEDFPQYASICLKIANKQGQQVPLLLNQAQLYVHNRLEEQRAKTGKVRALILKGRQQGISTYVEARFLHRLHWNVGLKAVVMAHQAASTSSIFGMVQRYAKNIPEVIRPAITRDAAGFLEFGQQDCGYRVATAGSDAIGRGWTAQLLHGSEFGFWASAAEHFSGIGQAIADMPGTEVILESTANQVGDEFHIRWQAAVAGTSDYIAIFVPWFWEAGYTRDGDITLTQAERDYQRLYSLTNGQMAWRRAKIDGDFDGDEARFMREYPSTPAEAFLASDELSLIRPDPIAKARHNHIEDDSLIGPVIIGVDPARFGDDFTAIVTRRGRKCLSLKRIHGLSTMQVVGEVTRAMRETRCDAVVIDIGGLGAGVFDRLLEIGYENVFGVNFGEKALNQDKYRNRRSEMWGLMKDWLSEGPVDIPDDEVLVGDLSGPHYSYDSYGRLELEKKEDMKKRGIKSPDAGDALALTFALPFNAIRRNEHRIINPEPTQFTGDSYAGY